MRRAAAYFPSDWLTDDRAREHSWSHPRISSYVGRINSVGRRLQIVDRTFSKQGGGHFAMANTVDELFVGQ